MQIFVFLGPSLPRQEAEKILPAIYLPPVAMGDVYNLVQQSAKPGDTILIVDGVFEQVPAVWHKEILHALTRGVHVYGASSMGALRAAELHSFGMVGLGQIFEWFQSGEIIDDDEVAVTHGPPESGYKSLSEAMVNIRAALGAAQQVHAISAAFAEYLLVQAKTLFYPDRSWPALLAKAREEKNFVEEISGLRQFLQARQPNQKREDAINALQYLAALREKPQAPFKADFDLEETSFWIGLTRTAAQRPSLLSSMPQEALHESTVHYLKTDIGRWEEFRTKGLVRYLIACLGDELTIDGGKYRDQLAKFCRARGLSTAAELETWLAANKLDKTALGGILQTRAKWHLLLQRHAEEIEYYSVSESKLDGTYLQAEERTREIHSTLAHLGVAKPSLQHAGIGADQLQDWYETKIQQKVNFSQESLADMGFASTREFINQLLGQYIYETRGGA